MAKQPLENPFQQQPKRERDPEMDAIDLDEKGTQNLGLGLTKGEFDALELLVRRSGLNRNKIMRIALSHFFVEIREGRLNLADFIEIPQPKPEGKLPR